MYRIVDRISLIIGIIIIGPVVILGLLLNGGYFDFIHSYELCGFYNATGLYCPGCGITRACFALFSGHLITSVLYHVIPVAAIVIYLLYMVYLFRLKASLKKRSLSFRDTYPEDIDFISRRFHKRLETAVYVVIGIAILQWIVKDVLLIFFNLDYFTLF